MTEPLNILPVNLPPIEFTQAKSMRERAVEIYRDHLDHQEWRMDGARLGMAADIIEAQANAIERVRALKPSAGSFNGVGMLPLSEVLAALEGKPA